MEAIIENGMIVNRIVGHIEGSYPIIDNPLTYDRATEVMTKEEVIDNVNKVVNIVYVIRPKTQEELNADFKASVPKVITPRQLRLALLQATLLDEVEALCSANKAMSIWFEYSSDFQRNHEMINAMASQLGLTEEQVDEFFIEASKL